MLFGVGLYQRLYHFANLLSFLAYSPACCCDLAHLFQGGSVPEVLSISESLGYSRVFPGLLLPVMGTRDLPDDTPAHPVHIYMYLGGRNTATRVLVFYLLHWYPGTR